MAVQGQEQRPSNPVLLDIAAPEMEQGLPRLDPEGLAELCFLWVTGGVRLTKRTIQPPSELLPSSPQSLGCRVSEG